MVKKLPPAAASTGPASEGESITASNAIEGVKVDARLSMAAARRSLRPGRRRPGAPPLSPFAGLGLDRGLKFTWAEIPEPSSNAQ